MLVQQSTKIVRCKDNIFVEYELIKVFKNVLKYMKGKIYFIDQELFSQLDNF